MNNVNLTNNNGAHTSDLADELLRTKTLAKELAAENEELKSKLEAIQIERDSFLGALRYHAPGQVFTVEDLEEFRKTAISGDQLLKELREKVNAWK